MKNLAWVLLVAVLAWTQRNASITSSVTDGSGAAVAGVEINSRNVSAGETLQAQSGDEGSYTFPLLPPGALEPQASKAGFKSHARTWIVLETGVAARADVKLDLGDVAESVTVSAELPQLQSETSAAGSAVKQETIANVLRRHTGSVRISRISLVGANPSDA